VSKLDGNERWKTKMLLTEHTHLYTNKEHERAIGQRKKPELDDQRLDEFSHIFAQSLEDHGPITVTVYDKRFDMEFRGIVMRVDQESRRIKLRTSEDDWDWIKIADIINVTT
jgi:hypothetical protein